MNFCTNCGEKLNSNARFCHVCGNSVLDAGNDLYKEDSMTSEHLRCPQCNSPISSFVAICPYCGCEVSCNNENSDSKELCNLLDSIEASRPQKGLLSMVNGLVNHMLDKSGQLEDTDKRKIEVISNFIISNNKNDIIEFMMLANSRVKTCEQMLRTSRSDEYNRIVQWQLMKVWEVKLNEVIAKGDLLLKGDNSYYDVRKAVQKDLTVRYKNRGLCAYCGGEFKGVFTRVCSICNKSKNY